MVVVFYISGHGFGHASRSIEVIRELQRLEPGARIVVRTKAPRWFLEGSLGGPLEVQPADTDTGVVQIDSLRLDEDETARVAARFYADFDRRTGEEARLLHALDATIVVGDIPPLAFAAAHQAGVPSVALGNFTWDWLYAGYPRFESIAPGVIDAIGHAYSLATKALRLPFTGGFGTMQPVARDIPLIARKATHTRDDARRALGIDEGPVALASFGGHGLGLSYARIAAQNDFTLVITDHEATNSAAREPHVEAGHRLRCFSLPDLARLGLRYADLVSAADVVVTKAGYGIVSECIVNEAALLYTPRDRFREHDIFVEEMPWFLRCGELSLEALEAGRWQDAVDAVLALPSAPRRLQSDGAHAAAMAITEYHHVP